MGEFSIFHVLKILLKTAFFFGVFLFCALRYMESRMLFYPTKILEVSPDAAGLEFRSIYFEAEDKVRLHGWLVPSAGAKYTVLFCHGNAGNISHRLEKIRSFHELGLSVLIFDYRGYGESQGNPSEKGLYKDVVAAYRYLRAQGASGGQIIGYGESLGGAVIAELASREEVRALILDSTFSNIRDMAKEVSLFIPSWMLASRFDSEKKLREVKCPKLIIHSLNDEIVPYRLGQKLYAVASEPKVFVETRGGHNSNYFESGRIWLSGVGNFIKGLSSD